MELFNISFLPGTGLSVPMGECLRQPMRLRGRQPTRLRGCQPTRLRGCQQGSTANSGNKSFRKD